MLMKSIAVACLMAAATSARVVSKSPYTFGWSESSQALSLDSEVKFTIAVQEQGKEEIAGIVAQVSDPDSALYGKYLSQQTIDDICRPLAKDMSAVTNWLTAAGIEFEQRGISNIDVVTSVANAQTLLSTNFHITVNKNAKLVRAGEYTIPDEVDESIATIFGLHGMPLPQTEISAPGTPAFVTPKVIYETYKVTEPKVRRSPKNRQAVAEFQGQFMNSTDLKNMFKALVTGYEAGVDDVVTKFVGEHEENSGGIEAELDIQYIMGVSPGIQTEFWEFPGNDFGADLNMWTSNLTNGDDVPLVHSVSYGWQGNLSQIGVKDSDVTVVDGNFAKLAAKGISIMISSGDSGSGYAPSNVCMSGGEAGVGIDGTLIATEECFGYSECCQIASEHSDAKGWTFEPEAVADEASKPIIFKDAIYHDVIAQGAHPIFADREVFSLTGSVSAAKGGVVAAKSLNKTLKGGEIHFSPTTPNPHDPQVQIFNVSGTFSGVEVMGRAEAILMPGQPAMVFNFEWFCKDDVNAECYVWERGPNPPPPPPPPPPGSCKVYSSVTSKTKVSDKDMSGFSEKSSVVLWASWPASSPYVTAVGATRFIGQKVGAEEMASDQFGSGGGFSNMFTQENAVYQQAAVAKYLSTVAPDSLPPHGSFDPKGRATPDVAALGEGFQVYVDGRPESVGGTSASSPTFAGLMSLLNEARLTAGKPAMGFLNPFLYKNADAFNDITVGSDKISRGGAPVPYGYNCSVGWDPATGLGTPKFDALMEAAMKA